MLLAQVESSGDGILSGAVGLVCKLEQVERWGEYGDDVALKHPLEALHDGGCECDGAKVMKVCDDSFFRHQPVILMEPVQSSSF